MGGPYLVAQVDDLCIDHCTIAQDLKKFLIKDLANNMTSAPIFSARVISDENIWMFFPLQFHFQFIYGYELTQCSLTRHRKFNC